MMIEESEFDLLFYLMIGPLDLDEIDIGLKSDRAEIDKINNNIKNKTTIRNAIKAGANCIKRGT